MYFLSRIFVDTTSSDILCNTEKDKSRTHHRTAGKEYALTKFLWQLHFVILPSQFHQTGILAGIRPCGIIVLLAELFTAESKSQVYANLHQLLRKNPCISKNLGTFPQKWMHKLESLKATTYINNKVMWSHMLTVLSLEFICYDDGCHLRKFARQATRQDLTPTAKKLAMVEIVIDKMHMAGHVDKWCLTNCDPHLFSALDKVSWPLDFLIEMLALSWIYKCVCYVWIYFQVDTEVC